MDEEIYNSKCRQRYLSFNQYIKLKNETLGTIELFKIQPTGVGKSLHERWLYSKAIVAENSFLLWRLEYTAGKNIDDLRKDFEHVISFYEQYASALRTYHKDNNRSVFDLENVNEYCEYIGLISICYLLHLKSLIRRVATLVDGVERMNAGQDWLIEEFLSFGDLERYDCESVLVPQPYLNLCEAFSAQDNDVSYLFLRKFLKNWYSELKATSWHDTHKSGQGYYGYWSFETACSVILLELDSDDELQQSVYYPKDLVNFYKNYQ